MSKTKFLIRKTILYPNLLGFLCVLLISCNCFKEHELLAIDHIRIKNLNRTGSVMQFFIRFHNHNKVRLKLKNAKGKVWIDDKYLGEFRLESLVHIPPLSEFIVPVRLQVKTGSLIQNTMSLLLKKQVHIKLEGDVKAGKGIIYATFPLRYEGKHNLEKILR